MFSLFWRRRMMDYFTRAGREGIREAEREIKCIRYGHVPAAVKISGPPGTSFQIAIPCSRCGETVTHSIWNRFDNSESAT